MTINQAGLDLLKEFEGCKLKAYKDIGDIWTIGYGDTENVKSGMVISQDEALERLKKRLVEFEDGVSKVVKVPIEGNQFSALVCFAYNAGLRAFSTSRMLAKLNQVDFKGAAAEFERWDKVNGVESKGLLRRRLAERDLFLRS